MISPEELVMDGHRPIAYGGFSEVWTGTYGLQKVALKCLKMSLTNEKKVLKASVNLKYSQRINLKENQ
jgi:hypothetical protein